MEEIAIFGMKLTQILDIIINDREITFKTKTETFKFFFKDILEYYVCDYFFFFF